MSNNYLKNILKFILYLGMFLILLELSLRCFFQLGNPILYNANEIYGYKPKSNQKITRKNNTITINNVGLRCTSNWDTAVDNKLIILGNSVTFGGSIVSDTQLCSYYLQQKLKNMQCASGGVNGWGIENIYEAYINKVFPKCKIVITILPEMDFYRGLVPIYKFPFWCHKPASAITELLHHYSFTFNVYSYKNNEIDNKNKYNVLIEKAVKKLYMLDSALKEHGIKHIVFISPTNIQLNKRVPIDSVVYNTLLKYKLPVNYLIKNLVLINCKEKHLLFYDDVHLTSKGHKVWADAIYKYLN